MNMSPGRRELPASKMKLLLTISISMNMVKDVVNEETCSHKLIEAR
jgi:hypothetical protein